MCVCGEGGGGGRGGGGERRGGGLADLQIFLVVSFKTAYCFGLSKFLVFLGYCKNRG